MNVTQEACRYDTHNTRPNKLIIRHQYKNGMFLGREQYCTHGTSSCRSGRHCRRFCFCQRCWNHVWHPCSCCYRYWGWCRCRRLRLQLLVLALLAGTGVPLHFLNYSSRFRMGCCAVNAKGGGPLLSVSFIPVGHHPK